MRNIKLTIVAHDRITYVLKSWIDLLDSPDSVLYSLQEGGTSYVPCKHTIDSLKELIIVHSVNYLNEIISFEDLTFKTAITGMVAELDWIYRIDFKSQKLQRESGAAVSNVTMNDVGSNVENTFCPYGLRNHWVEI